MSQASVRTIPAAGLFEFMKARQLGASVEEAFRAAGADSAPEDREPVYSVSATELTQLVEQTLKPVTERTCAALRQAIEALKERDAYIMALKAELADVQRAASLGRTLG
jgi:hypothetical protein